MILRDQFDEWLRVAAIDLAPTTIGWYRSMGRHLEPLMDTEIGELTDAQVNQLWLDLLERYEKNTVKGVQGTLSALLREAGIPVPGKRIRVPKGISGGRHGVWTAQQARSFLEYAAADRYSHAFALALVCGLRRGELLGLTWEDIDLEEGLLYVRRQQCVANGVPGVLTRPPKGYKPRTIPIGPSLVALLSSAPRRGAWLITSRKGKPLYPTALSQHFSRLCHRAGVPVIALHDARHTSATVGSVAGVDIKTMQSRLGHADTKMLTEVYLHAVTEAARTAAVSMEKAFGL